MLTILYLVIALGLFIYFFNDAANTEATYSERRLHYSPNDWLLVSVGSALWLIVLVVGLLYGLAFTMYYQLVDHKRAALIQDEETDINLKETE